MTEQLKSFMETMAQDQSLAEALNAAETPEAVIALAKEKGITLTEQDLALAQAPVGELSDDDLDDVAGGAINFASNTVNSSNFGGSLARLLFTQLDRGQGSYSTLESRGQDGGGFSTLESRTDKSDKSGSKSGMGGGFMRV
jgi:predicted ribosomally synthesized peptide with nif11-like leader